MTQKNLILSYKLTKSELGEARAIQSLVKQEQYKSEIIKGNTALVHKGLDCDKTQRDIAKLLEGSFQTFMYKLAKEHNMKGEVSINLETGVITNI